MNFRPPPFDPDFDPNYDASEEGQAVGGGGGHDPRSEARAFLTTLLQEMRLLREALDRNTAAALHRTGVGTAQQRGGLEALIGSFLKGR